MPIRKDAHTDTERLTAREIFESASTLARDELERPLMALSFSGIAGGLTMGLTGLSTGLVTWILGTGAVGHLSRSLLPDRISRRGYRPR